MLKRVALLFSFLPAHAFSGSAPYEQILHVRVAMRDGVHLDTNAFYPAPGKRYGAILVRTPYGKGAGLSPAYRSFVDQGFAFVIQDVRGRYNSEGVFDAFEQEGNDGYDTLNWIARQPWSNGSVGMTGGSYLGISQWKAAVLNNPHLKAMFPVVSGDDDYFDRFYSRGGASKLGHRLLWLSENLALPGIKRPLFGDFIYHVPLRTADRYATGRKLELYQSMLNHPVYDAFWKRMSIREKLDRVHVPVFSVGGWYDNYVESDLEAFSVLQRHGTPAQIVIGPWPHNMSVRFENVDYGTAAGAPIRRYQVEWFDHWLRGGPPPEDVPARIFVMGVNHWREEREWPIARTHYRALYLGGRGHANSLKGDGDLDWIPERKTTPDMFTYDPKNPVPTRGGNVCCNPKIFPWGPMDQRGVEARKDVLVYTGRPLRHDLEITGPVKVVLYAATSAPDTDFTAKLVDVFPDGEARNLCDGMLRLRYREGVDRVVPTLPGALYTLTLDVGVTSNVFLAGHRIRLEISSSNFPRFDRNPNTGRPVADEVTLKKAKQTVYHGGVYPSHLVLPVIPELAASTRVQLTSANRTRYGPREAHLPAAR